MKYREADLHYIYIRVGTQNKSLADLSENEFIDWVTSKINQYQLDKQDFFPIKGISLQDRVNTINQLQKVGVSIYMVKREARHKFDYHLKNAES